MATYTPIQTGYKPEGALGGLYAGENAAMARLQSDIANLADLFDLQQTGVTTQQKQFDLDKARQFLPSDLAIAEQKRLTALSESTPEVIKALTSGKVGTAQSQTATGAYDTAMLPSKIELGKLENIQKAAQAKGDTYITEVSNVYNKFLTEGSLSAANYVNSTYQDPTQREAMHNLVRKGQKGFQTLFDEYSKAQPKHIQEMTKQSLVNAGNLAVARVNAQGTVTAATRNANAAMAAGDKNSIVAASNSVNQGINLLKELNSELQASIEGFKNKKEQSKEYQSLLTEQRILKGRILEMQTLSESLARKLVEPTPFIDEQGRTSVPTPAPAKLVQPSVVDTDITGSSTSGSLFKPTRISTPLLNKEGKTPPKKMNYEDLK